MRKLGGNSDSKPSKTATESLLGAPVSDDQVVGEINGQKITGKDVREAEEFGEYMDDLVALYFHVQQNPDDKEAVERFTLNVQYLQQHHLFTFLEVAFGLWQMYRQITNNK